MLDFHSKELSGEVLSRFTHFTEDVFILWHIYKIEVSSKLDF